MPFTANKGIRIHYEVAGQGAPLVLQHSLGRSLDAWWDFGYAQVLSQDYQLILIDARGHGASDKPHDAGAYQMEGMVGDVVAVLDALGISRAHYYGNDRIPHHLIRVQPFPVVDSRRWKSVWFPYGCRAAVS